jgi:hypothetical protein
MEDAMPLTRARQEFVTSNAGIDFLMEDDNVPVPCRAEREMLRDRFGSDDDKSAAAEFEENREEIEQAQASNMTLESLR